MSIILPYFYIVSMSFTLMTLFNKKFHNIVLLSFLFSIIFLYSGGLIENIKLGFYISCLFCIVWIPIIIFGYIKKRLDIKKILIENLSIPFVVFTGIFIFISIYERFATFSLWDEYTHWGPMVKEMFRLNKFYCANESYLTFHQEYPPFPALLELLWCYLSNGFEERFLFRGIAIFSACFIVPIIGNIKDDKSLITKISFTITSLFIFTVVFFISLDDFNNNLQTIYPDALCGLISAYTLFYISSNDKPSTFDYLNISLFLGTILLIKQINIAFYALIIFYALIKYLLINKEKKVKKIILFIVIIPLIIFLSWKIYISQFDLKGQFDLNIESIVLIFKNNEINNPNSYRSIVYSKYINALLNKSIMKNINISYFLLSAIITMMIFALLILMKKKRESILMVTSLSIGAIGYAFTMLVLYLTSYSEYEATNLASFGRYMSIYIYFELCLLVFAIVFYCLKCLDSKKGLIVLLVSSIFTGFISKDNLTSFKIKNNYDGYEFTYRMQELIKQFDEYVDINDKVLVINQIYDSRLNLELEFRYLGYNIRILGITTSAVDDIGNYLSTDANGFKNYYKDFDYVYTYFTDDEFTSVFWMDQEEYMLNNRLYFVDDNGYLRLMPWTSSEEY